MLKQHSLKFILALGSLIGYILVSPLAAQQPPAQPRNYSPSDATSEILPKYKAATDANNYDEALAILDAQIPKAAPGSYDLALLYQIKAQTLLQKGDFPNSIEPLEKGLALSDAVTPTYFEDKQVATLVFFLAQLYFQEAVQTKNPTLAAANFEKADKYVQRWSKLVPKPTYENQLFHARFLYSKAAQNPDHPDLELIQKALVESDKGLLMSNRPKDDFYLLKFVCLQQLNRNQEAAEILELLVKNKPESASYWQQLASLYLTTEQTTRAVLTLERAQSNGHMNTPKDNFNLIGILFNIGQYSKAAELLETGLREGKIDQTTDNWELLALCYQQMDRPLKAVEAFKEATKHFPESGQIEYMIAQAYQALDQPANALKHAQAAAKKGNLTKSKPHQLYFFIAYMAYELKNFELALEYAKKTAQFPEGVRDGNNLSTAIEDIMKEREAKKSKM